MVFSGKYYIQVSVLHKCSAAAFDQIHQRVNVYEVIKIIDGIPLFSEKHCNRLIQSATHINLFIDLDFDDLLQKNKNYST